MLAAKMAKTADILRNIFILCKSCHLFKKILTSWPHSSCASPSLTASYSERSAAILSIDQASCSVVAIFVPSPPFALVAASVPDLIWIHRIHMVLGLPDPDPLVRGMDLDPAPDPDPSTVPSSKNSKKNLDSYCL
jgi:hypothetical protein